MTATRYTGPNSFVKFGVWCAMTATRNTGPNSLLSLVCGVLWLRRGILDPTILLSLVCGVLWLRQRILDPIILLTKFGVWCAITAIRNTGPNSFVKFGVWCAMTATRNAVPNSIVRPLTHTNSVHKRWHHFCRLTDTTQPMPLRPENVTAHIAKNSVHCLEGVLGQNNTALWPPLSPDLNTCNIY